MTTTVHSYPTTLSQQLHALHAALHLTHTPESMPGRTTQQATIETFLRDHVDAGRGGSMYVSGAPGTGKTASVEYVLHKLYGHKMLASHTPSTATASEEDAASARNKLKRSLFNQTAASTTTSANGSNNGPRIIYTNAMTFSSQPRQLYPKLLAQLKSLSIDEEAALSPMDALEELKSIFCPGSSMSNPKKSPSKSSTASKSGMTLVILDEVDALLIGASPAVLYHLLEWPLTTGSRLVVISISNSINLLEQKLPHLATRNALPISLVFNTYSKEELKKIVEERCNSIYPPEPTPSKLKASKPPTKSKLPPKSPTKPTATSTNILKTPVKSAPSTPKKSPSSKAAEQSAPTTPQSTNKKKSHDRWKLPETVPTPPPGRISRSAAAKLELITAPDPSAKFKVNTSIADLMEDVEPASDSSPSKRGRKRKQDDDSTKVVVSESSLTDTMVDEPELMEIEKPTTLAEAEDDQVEDGLVTPKKKKAKLTICDSPASCTDSSPLGRPLLDESLLAPLSTRALPFFDSFALDLLCAKVAKGSGDLRKVLEVARKAVDALQLEWEGRLMLARERLNSPGSLSPMPTTPVAASGVGTSKRPDTPGMDARSDGAPSPYTLTEIIPTPHAPPTPLQVSISLLHSLTLTSLGSSNDQSQLLRVLPSQQKIVLIIACLLSHLQSGREILRGFSKHYSRFSTEFRQVQPLRGDELADLLAALQAHRLIKLISSAKPRRTNSSGGGSGANRRMSGSGGGGGGNSNGLAIQVNITTDALHAAYDDLDDQAVFARILTEGQSFARRIIATNQIKTSRQDNPDYQVKEFDE